MPDPERAKLFPVNGPNDSPEGDGISVQFNPTTLKVSLANTLKSNPRGGNSRAAQFVDKSSSTMTVELIFDTSETFVKETRDAGTLEERQIDTRNDVRQRTKEIAENFIKPIQAGSRMRAPKRCLFQWGAFEFVGLVQSFDETLDFFSPEGTPLRATVALKLSEDRFQFRTRETQEAEQDTPSLTPTGGDEDNPNQDADSVSSANAAAGESEKDWRDTAMYNGVESPRLPSASALAVPKLSAGASLGASVGASASFGVSASIGASAGLGVGASLGAGASLGGGVSAKLTPPGFKFGASTSLGTGIAGAFSPGGKASAGLSAGSIVSGGVALRGGAGITAGAVAKAGTDVKVSAAGGAKAGLNIGFD